MALHGIGGSALEPPQVEHFRHARSVGCAIAPPPALQRGQIGDHTRRGLLLGHQRAFRQKLILHTIAGRGQLMGSERSETRTPRPSMSRISGELSRGEAVSLDGNVPNHFLEERRVVGDMKQLVHRTAPLSIPAASVVKLPVDRPV